jgi:dihydroflavonol-4-reductase
VSPVAAITGASGFVGGAVASELVEAGYSVRALVRSRAAEAAVTAIGPAVTAVASDVLDPETMTGAFAGADLVVHAAGVIAACRRDPSAMLRTNVIGTRNAVTAAARVGVGRVVVTSSAATIGERAGEIGREDTPHRGWYLSAYERSKTEAEAAAFALGRDLGVEVVAVNPASVQGPGRMDGTARLLLSAARARIPVIVRTTLSFVDVADCARGHLLAARVGRPGQRYLLCGATMPVEAALALVGSVTGRRRRAIALPIGVAATAAAIVETAFRVARRDPPICGEAMAAVAHGRAYDGSRATRDLGLAYTPAERTIARAIDWFRQIGALGDT